MQKLFSLIFVRSLALFAPLPCEQIEADEVAIVHNVPLRDPPARYSIVLYIIQTENYPK